MPIDATPFGQLALAVAERLNITVCGYLRQGSMNVYTHPWRIDP